MRKNWLACGIVAALALLCSTSSSRAAVVINEIAIDLPGGDSGQEYFEIRSTTDGVESLDGLTLLVLEGDGASPGVVDVALSLNGFSTGTNGLFLWRDTATVLNPAPAAATTLNVVDFNPDLENGSNTFMLVRGWTGTVAMTDIDADNNGIVDAGPFPWTGVVDAIGVRENDGASNVAYASQFGGADFPQFVAFNGDMIFRLRDTLEWVSADVNGSSPGPYTYDPVEAGKIDGSAIDPATFDIGTSTPGNINPQVVPEPSACVVASLGLIGLVGLARRPRPAAGA
jgi:hypothetical protein